MQPNPDSESSESSPQPFGKRKVESSGELATSDDGEGKISLLQMSPTSQRRPRTLSGMCAQGKQSFKGRIVLFYAKEMEALAQEIAAFEDQVVLGDISWSRFPDSFPNLKIGSADNLKWAKVAFLASLHDPGVIFEQLSLMYALPRYLTKSFKVVLPFFPTGTMERIQSPGEVATAATLARMLSCIPPCARGPAQISVFDIHTLQNQFYFTDNVLIRLATCLDLLLHALAQLPDRQNITIAFPDEGAYKRFSGHFDTFPTIVCHKIRDGDKRIVRIREGDANKRHVVIVDDLVQSGGTLVEAASTLRANGASQVSAYVTHAIFPNESWRKFTSKNIVDNFWITNTHPTATTLNGKPPFKVLSIAPLVSGIILDTD